MTATYEVIVGNVGTVYTGPDKATAEGLYTEYREVSMAGTGRAGNEAVTLLRDGELLREYLPLGEDDGSELA